jgi:hypothetical protein
LEYLRGCVTLFRQFHSSITPTRFYSPLVKPPKKIWPCWPPHSDGSIGIRSFPLIPKHIPTVHINIQRLPLDEERPDAIPFHTMPRLLRRVGKLERLDWRLCRSWDFWCSSTVVEQTGASV